MSTCRLKFVVAVFISVAAMLPNHAASLRADEPAKQPAPDWRAMFQMHYGIRVQNFREQNQMLQNVVLVGDSITEGFDVAKWFPGRRVLNRGIGADVIGNALAADDKRGVLKRLDESFFDCSTRDAFLLIGINDLGDSHTPEVMQAGYRRRRCACMCNRFYRRAITSRSTMRTSTILMNACSG
jgi:hypothetical protein